ncbi:RDD family protein [Thiorhodovibrio winogradskyi]|uniref:RDD family protein n=1 Tax=Thiorhodovibrio winogradskyi TaxID=77007 RepID=A0ABZ0S755_9GAMM|nr:RDD family protein [Thiorhodovibrio winogradskyi]
MIINDSSSNLSYAGFWFRFIAAIVDIILCQILIIVIVFPLAYVLGLYMAETASASDIESTGEALGTILGIFIQWLYFTVQESSTWQATVGKKMFGMTVTDMGGKRISFGRANARYWSKILSALILMIGYLMVAFTAKKQGLHDLIAGTLVLRNTHNEQ